VPLVDAPTRHVFVALLPSEHRLAAVQAMLELLRQSAAARVASSRK